MRHPLVVGLSLILGSTGLAQAQEQTYSFSPSEYQHKAFELGGYAEGKFELFRLNPDSAFYELNKPSGNRPGVTERATGTLEITGKYHKDITSLNFTLHGDGDRDVVFGNNSEARLYEGGLGIQPETGLSFYLGKKTLFWGKGYAWNPVGFVQRPKDPTDPDQAREGYAMAMAGYTRSLTSGPIRTIGFTSAIIPTTSAINGDFGQKHHLDVAGKLYMLIGRTDVDVMALSGGAKAARYGADFSSAVTPALEIHGELAYISTSTRAVLGSVGQPVPITGSATSYLLGMNYLTEANTTFILEYYHNGEGLTESEASAFYATVHRAVAAGIPAPLQGTGGIGNAYMRPNPMREYLDFKVSQKEPFDILYFTPSVTVQANLTDHSYLLLPELLYTGYKDIEVRLRGQFNIGPPLTEFGEKQASCRVELRVRYYF